VPERGADRMCWCALARLAGMLMVSMRTEALDHRRVMAGRGMLKRQGRGDMQEQRRGERDQRNEHPRHVAQVRDAMV
jgi:hypothetical protein